MGEHTLAVLSARVRHPRGPGGGGCNRGLLELSHLPCLLISARPLQRVRAEWGWRALGEALGAPHPNTSLMGTRCLMRQERAWVGRRKEAGTLQAQTGSSSAR